MIASSLKKPPPALILIRHLRNEVSDYRNEDQRQRDDHKHYAGRAFGLLPFADRFYIGRHVEVGRVRANDARTIPLFSHERMDIIRRVLLGGVGVVAPSTQPLPLLIPVLEFFFYVSVPHSHLILRKYQ